jgi:hypothetical protein
MPANERGEINRQPSEEGEDLNGALQDRKVEKIFASAESGEKINSEAVLTALYVEATN